MYITYFALYARSLLYYVQVFKYVKGGIRCKYDEGLKIGFNILQSMISPVFL